MQTRRTTLAVLARVLGGVAAVTVFGVIVAAVGVLPAPIYASTVPAVHVEPQMIAQERVCPGPLLTLADDASPASFGRADVVTTSGDPGAINGAAFAPNILPLAAVNPFRERDGSPVVVEVPLDAPGVDGGEAPAQLFGSESQNAAQAHVSGFASAVCGDVSSNSWLVGGSTDTGRTTLVLLANPGGVDAVVDLTVFGEAGKVSAPGSTGIRVAAGSQRVVPLAGVAPNLRSPVVHVTARGGQVSAVLQQSVVRGVTPGGVEFVGATAGPASFQTLVGVDIHPAASSSLAGNDTGYDDSQPSLRLLSTGDLPANITISIAAENGAAGGDSFTITTDAGVATEVPLAGLTPGTFTVTVESDQPIVAAARSTIAGGMGGDFAWSTASHAVGGDFLVSVAAGSSPVLHLVSVSTEDTTITVTSSTGQIYSAALPAGKSAGVPVNANASYTVAGGNGVLASVSYKGDGQASAFAINPPNPLAASVTVYPG